MRCSVQNCTNDTKRTTKSNGVTFHMFPKEPNLRTAWIEALGMEDWEPKDRSTICSEHFRNEDFYDTKCGLRKIKNGAVPVVVQDSSEDLEAPAALRVCRICLVMDTRMYHIKENRLDLAYEQIMGAPLSEEDKLPQKICWECAQRLIKSSNFKGKAQRSQSLMMDMLITSQYITIRDIKSVNRAHNHLKSNLITKYYEPNDYDILIKDNQEFVKTENGDTEVTEVAEEGLKEELPPIVAVEIKDEQSNDIFFDEFVDNDNFDESDDDKKLSEVLVEKDKPKRVKKLKKKVEKKPKVDKKPRVEKRTRVPKAKKEKPVKEQVEEQEIVLEEEKEKDSAVDIGDDDDDDPSSTMDKYKKSDVKRRKTQDGLDETLFTISALTYEEQIEEIQQRAEATAYKTAPFKCEVCYRGFLIQDRYEAHAIRHSEASGAYECFICKTRLKTGRALRKHLTAQHTEKFSCKGCPFVTRNRGVAREHEKWHAGTKYQCPHCPSEFDKLTTYMGHIRIKHVSDFVCELCGYTFVSKKGIDVHKKKKHRLDKTVYVKQVYDHPCEICGFTFVNKKGINVHKKKKHANEKVPVDGPFCEVCQVRFKTDEAHDRHLKLSSRHSSDNDPNRIRNDSQSMNSDKNGRVMRKIERRPTIHPREPGDKHLPDPPGPVTCEQCGMQLRDLRLYAQHFRRAHPDKNRTKYPAMKTPCMCEQCGRIFQSMALLKDHMWVHTGEKRFKCDRCEKSFTQKTNLVFHMRVHSATRPTYECPLCGKHFAFFNNRRRHMFIHTGLKPFKCDTCGKCFTTSGEHRAHVEHVHLKKPWPKRARSQRHQTHHDWQLKCNLPQVED